MIINIPNQRQFPGGGKGPFDDLVAYIEENKGKDKEAPVPNLFGDVISYTSNLFDKETNEEKCIAIRTHGVLDISTASAEMNAVAIKNKKCTDPAYHFILSWPEHEKSSADKIFDAAEHALAALGLAEHQYVVAIHGNTDNRHCHVAVNRIHPTTFKSHHIEWAQKTLHYAARQSEIKHGWTHDNGIYIVETDARGNKTIALNPDHAQGLADATPKTASGPEDLILPTWHDPETLEAWLKTTVARELKRAMPKLRNWADLHAWLQTKGIVLTDSGGGGLRLAVKSPESDGTLNIAASKGLRFLKRAELEKRWGLFSDPAAQKYDVPDLSHLTPAQIAKGVKHVLNNTLDAGIPPYHVLYPHTDIGRLAAQRSRGLHDVPDGRLATPGQDSGLLVPNALHDGLGDEQAGADNDLRRTGATSPGSGSARSLNRNDALRAERKEQRAAMRADLRNRFAQYKRFVAIGDTEYFQRSKEISATRSAALKEIVADVKMAKKALHAGTRWLQDTSKRLNVTVEIDASAMRRRLQVDADAREKKASLQATRVPPLSWRAWLFEQSNLGDQAAVSALRGIVYQAQRDAKKGIEADADEPDDIEDLAAYREAQYKKVLARLQKEEQEEVAIRAASVAQMRPHEVDALFTRIAGLQARVTGNGNIQYSDIAGAHLFTDRGNRLTFDRVRVSDDEIRIALLHAQQKFGMQVTLTGDDPDFTKRMARLADDLGMRVLNPSLQQTVQEHRQPKKAPARIEVFTNKTPAREPAEATRSVPPATLTPERESRPTPLKKPLKKPPSKPPVKPVPALDTVPAIVPEEVAVPTAEERLRALVLSIDPHAQFELADVADTGRLYSGPIAASFDDDTIGFAQRTGRGLYTIHPSKAPAVGPQDSVDVRYQNGNPVTVAIPTQDRGR